MVTKFANGLGVTVSLENSTGTIRQSTKGNKAFAGILKRGPVGHWIPLGNQGTFDKIFGKRGVSEWGIYPNSESLLPDAVKAFFDETGERGRLWLLRIALEGATAAVTTMKDRHGSSVVRWDAANPGRWAGFARSFKGLPLVLTTANTFTVKTPGVLANNMVGAVANFGTGRNFKVVANTSASDGLVVYTLSSDVNLAAQGISGPVSLTGTATHATTATITGTISFSPTVAINGTVTVDPLSPLNLVGTETDFVADFEVGDSVFFGGEERIVTQVSSATAMVIDAGFGSPLSNATISKSNLEVVGVTTKFTGEGTLSKVVSVGTPLTVDIGGTLYTRTVAAITDATHLTLTSGFPASFSGKTATIPNLYLEGTGTNFTAELAVGTLLLDPTGPDRTPVAVAQVVDGDTVKLEAPFAANFTGQTVQKVTAVASVELVQPANTGLRIVTSPGERRPTTHFKVDVYFEEDLVFSIPDADLNPASPLFLETQVLDAANNSVTDGKGVSSWPSYVTATSLFNGEYETSEAKDVRPWSGSGKVLALSGSRLYTVADFDYGLAQGNWVYPSIYGSLPKNRYRLTTAVAPVAIEGTYAITANAKTITGTNTNFRAVFGSNYDVTANPAYLYDVTSGMARLVASVTDDTHLVLDEAFPSSVFGAARTGKKAGYLSLSQGQTFVSTEVGDTFVVSYPVTLTGGSDGNLADINPFSYIRYFDIDNTNTHLKAAVTGLNQGFLAIGLPGVTDLAVQSAVRDYAERTAYFFQNEFPPTILSGIEAEAYQANNFGKSNNACSPLFPSYAYKIDEATGQERLYSLTGNLFGKEAIVAISNDGYHVVAAGTQEGNGILRGIRRLPVALAPNEVKSLSDAGIRPITLIDGRPTIWGANIAAADERYKLISTAYTVLDYINMFQEQTSILDLMFRNNQPNIDEQLKIMFNLFGRQEYRKGVYSQDVPMDYSFSFDLIEPDGQGSSPQDRIIDLERLLSGVRGGRYRFVPAGLVTEIEIILGVQGISDIAEGMGLI